MTALAALLVDGKDPKEIATKLNSELESCQQWLIDNKLSLHRDRGHSFWFKYEFKENK